MICFTANDQSLLEHIEEKLQLDISVTLLAELERELLRLRSELSPSEWKQFCDRIPDRPLFQTLRLSEPACKRVQEPFTSIPADVMRIVAAKSFPARPAAGQSAAHILGAWEFSLPASRSMRIRHSFFSREISETIRTCVKPRILILGSGYLPEAIAAVHAAHLSHAEFVALESDSKLVADLLRQHSAYPLIVRQGTWLDFAQTNSDLGLFDLIYSTGWLDSSDDPQASEWLGAASEMLRAGGRILAANFAPGSRDAGWVEACWNWHPRYRSEEHVARLIMDLKQPGIRGHTIFRDESGASVYLEIHSL